MSFDYEITPEPEPDEAAALIVALEQAVAEDGAFAEPPARSAAWARREKFTARYGTSHGG